MSTCNDIITAYPLRNFLPSSLGNYLHLNGSVGIGGLVLGVCYLLNAGITFYWVRKQSIFALEGMIGSAKNVIFRYYWPIMIASACSDLLLGLVIFFVQVNFLSGANSWSSAVAVAIAYASQHFVLEGISFILIQQGCGRKAFRNACLYSSIWSLTTFLFLLFSFKVGSKNSIYWGLTDIWNFCLLCFYSFLWLLPEKRLCRRPALVFYARFWSIFRFIYFLSVGLIIMGASGVARPPIVNYGISEAGECTYIFSSIIVFVLCKPLLVYYTLLQDSQWWQGTLLGDTPTPNSNKFSKSEKIENNSEEDGSFPSGSCLDYFLPPFLRLSLVARTSISSSSTNLPLPKHYYEAISSPLLGTEIGYDDAQELAKEVDRMRSEGTIKLINFAFIRMVKQPLLGAGSCSKVYSGRFKGKIPVAIKMLFTTDLNPEVIRRCSNEARILSEISPHPNVVSILGVSIMPPSVCLVLEICAFGSLSDVLRGISVASAGTMKARFPFNLSTADRMFLALGCAKGLAALHNYSAIPGLCHRDIKSYNFLIDDQLNSKIADLELGSFDFKSTSKSKTSENDQRKYRDNIGMNITWQAPEVLRDEEYTQKSDIYSLALVLWEIIATRPNFSSFSHHSHRWVSESSQAFSRLSGSSSGSNKIHSPNRGFSNIPFSEFCSQTEVKEKILQGVRPSITSSMSLSTDLEYINIISTCWDDDPNSRLSVNEIVKKLYNCWCRTVHKLINSSKFITNNEIVHRENNRRMESQILRYNSQIQTSHPPPPSGEVLDTLLVMQLEKNWIRLEEEESCDRYGGNIAFVVLTPGPPFHILWATKKFSQFTGYLLNDLIALDINLVYGRKTNDRLISEMMSKVSCNEELQHIVTTIYRKDGNPSLCSIHMYPVYNDSNSSIQEEKFSIKAFEQVSDGSLSRGNSFCVTVFSDVETSVSKKSFIGSPCEFKIPCDNNESTYQDDFVDSIHIGYDGAEKNDFDGAGKNDYVFSEESSSPLIPFDTSNDNLAERSIPIPINFPVSTPEVSGENKNSNQSTGSWLKSVNSSIKNITSPFWPTKPPLIYEKKLLQKVRVAYVVLQFSFIKDEDNFQRL